MSTSLDEVIETVRAAREDGPEALAAMALSYGATMALGAIGNRALRGRIAEMREAARAADEDIATLQHERDAALAELKHALESTAETRAEVWRLRESVAALRAERDESQAAHEHTRAQWATACRERDEAGAALAAAGKIAAEAVREREAFGLRASAAERERDEARAERDEARAERDAAREALAAKDSAPDLDYPARAEVWRLRESVAALQDERDRVVQEREVFGLRASAAERERDEARAERDALRARPTYEARTVAPTDAEWRGHFRAGGSWLVLRTQWVPMVAIDPDTYRGLLHTQRATWLPLGATGLPCAWPVAGEVSP